MNQCTCAGKSQFFGLWWRLIASLLYTLEQLPKTSGFCVTLQSFLELNFLKRQLQKRDLILAVIPVSKFWTIISKFLTGTVYTYRYNYRVRMSGESDAINNLPIHPCARRKTTRQRRRRKTRWTTCAKRPLCPSRKLLQNMAPNR